MSRIFRLQSSRFRGISEVGLPPLPHLSTLLPLLLLPLLLQLNLTALLLLLLLLHFPTMLLLL